MIYTQEEINDVCKLEFSTKKKTVKTQEKLNAILDIAVQRYNKETNKEKKDEFKGASSKFIRTYSFILQIGPFADVSLHKLYVYLNYLLKKLPKNVSEGVYLADDVALEYYRNDKIFEGSISLSIGEESELKPTSFGKGVGAEEEKKKLSEIIEKLNDKFATDFTDTDKLSYEQIKEDIINNVDLAQKAQNNTKDNFKFSYQKAFLDVVIARMAQNEKFFMKILEDSDFKDTIMEFMFDEVYQSFSKII